MIKAFFIIWRIFLWFENVKIQFVKCDFQVSKIFQIYIKCSQLCNVNNEIVVSVKSSDIAIVFVSIFPLMLMLVSTWDDKNVLGGSTSKHIWIWTLLKTEISYQDMSSSSPWLTLLCSSDVSWATILVKHVQCLKIFQWGQRHKVTEISWTVVDEQNQENVS